MPLIPFLRGIWDLTHGILQCVIPENIHTHLMEGHWKLRGGTGPQQPKLLVETYQWLVQWTMD